MECAALMIRHIFRETNTIVDWMATFVVDHLGDFMWSNVWVAPMPFKDIMFCNFSRYIYTRFIWMFHYIKRKKIFIEFKRNAMPSGFFQNSCNSTSLSSMFILFFPTYGMYLGSVIHIMPILMHPLLMTKRSSSLAVLNFLNAKILGWLT